jgi:hypothetical protein
MDTNKEFLMVIKWQDKGCKSCRDLWKSGQRPQELAINYDLHSRLHKCKECGTYWEQHERYADIIDESEARKLYPDAFIETEK